MYPENNEDAQQELVELIILLVIGNSPRGTLSVLHVQKEVFLIYKFHPEVKDLLIFIKHHKGPFSRQIEETIRKPIILDACWHWKKPSSNDKLTGGYVIISPKGKKECLNFIESVKKQREGNLKESLLHLISGIQIVTLLYSKLTPEELLLLIYETFPEMIEKSSVYDEIMSKKPTIAIQLFQKQVIDREKCQSLRRQKTWIL